MKKIRAACYCRVSTSELRQDVSLQIAELERYCKASDWEFDVIIEFDSAYKGSQPKLTELLERIRLKRYNVLMVHSLDRFSRGHPQKVNALLDQVVYDFGCRFIAIQQSIDSNNPLIWNAIKPLFTYFANEFSRNLSEKIQLGIKRKKEKGQYKGGRPALQIDNARFIGIVERLNGNGSYRRVCSMYNHDLPKSKQISHSSALRLLQKHRSKSLCEIS